MEGEVCARLQTKNCWQNWVDFHKCTAARGEDFPVCQKFKKVYRSLCPNEWVRRRKTPRRSALATQCERLGKR